MRLPCCSMPCRFQFIIQINFRYRCLQPKFVIVVGTIKAIMKENNWYYEGCKFCNSRVEKATVPHTQSEGSSTVDDNSNWIRNNDNCEKQEITAITRFRIPIRVQDSSGVVTLTMFDREANKLLKTTALNLLQDPDQYLDDDPLPKQFKLLIDTKFAFKIQVKTINLRQKIEFYSISKMTDDQSIFSQLEKNFYLDRPAESDSLNQSVALSQGNNSYGIKESKSCIGDNLTPLMEYDKSNGKKPISGDFSPSIISNPHSLKRNLQDVYDCSSVIFKTSCERKESGSQTTHSKN